VTATPPQHDNSTCNTTCDMMTATTTPMWHDNNTCYTMYGTTMATATPNAALQL